MKHHKGSALPILILIIVITIAISSFVYIKTFIRQQHISVSIPTPTPIFPIPEIDTSNSKTYTNTKYNFSLKYPYEWKETEESDSLLTSRLSDSYYFTPSGMNPHTGKSVYVTVILKNSGAGLPYEDLKGWFDSIYKRSTSESNSLEDEIKLDNLNVDEFPAVKMKTRTNKEEILHPAAEIQVYVFKDPYLYVITAHQGGGHIIDQNLQDNFDQILSTFKFID